MSAAAKLKQEVRSVAIYTLSVIRQNLGAGALRRIFLTPLPNTKSGEHA